MDDPCLVLNAKLKEKKMSKLELSHRLKQPFSSVANRLGGYAPMTGKFYNDVLEVLEVLEEKPTSEGTSHV